ncbi:MAG: DUF2207 family protein, partial [Gaiellaceae bacterium]
MSRALRLGFWLALAALFGAAAAPARATVLHGAAVDVAVTSDGSLQVREQITMSDVFHGAYRDIPVRPNETIDRISVSEQGRRYSYGGSTELGSIGQPDTFASTRIGSGERIVWHFDNPSSGPRTFVLDYRFRGLAIAYQDVVDVNLNVWGDQWGQSLPSLRATLRLPRPTTSPSYRVWAGPAWVHGVVERRPAEAALQAASIPSHQLVDLRVVFPRSLLSSTSGASQGSGSAFDRIVAEEQASFAAYDRDRRRLRTLERSPLTWIVLALLGIGPSLAIIGLVYARYGHEPKVGYGREYEQEPPSELAPALVPTLVRERGGAGTNEFAATLFDLIRRGRYKAEHVTTERAVWGGIRHETVSDLQLSQGTPLAQQSAWEDSVAKIVDPIVAGEGERLSSLHERIAEDRTGNAKQFQAFRESVGDEIGRLRWYRNSGLALLLATAFVLLMAGAIGLFVGVGRFRVNAPRVGDVVTIALAICAIVNAAILGVAATRVPLWRSRTAASQQEALRWNAFRHYLTDFPRLKEAAPASLALWERYLVYGIAFGIADRVLQAAHLQMPEELHDQSSIFWISPNGGLGAGVSAFAISDLTSGLGSSLSPPSSGGSGGFGGDFGGGGFGGGGGGG